MRRTPGYRISGNATLGIPFVANEPLPLVAARVNGRDGLFLIDTGAGDITLDPAFASEAGIASIGSSSGTFAGGRTAALTFGRIETFALEGLTIANVPATMLPTRNIPFFPGKRVDGIIGTVLFYHFLATLDYPNAKLRLEPRTTQAPSGIIVPLKLVGDHFMFARGSVNGVGPLLLLVDSGLAGGGFLAAPATIARAHIKLDNGKAGTGTGGAVKTVPFKLDSLALGSAEQAGIAGLYTPEGAPFGIFPFDVAGIISHDFLKHYAVTFDFTKMQIILAA